MPPSDPIISIIIPANNEAAYIEACLQSLCDQIGYTDHAEVIVSANACTDTTVEKAARFEDAFKAKGWSLQIIDSPDPGKLGAINRAEAATQASVLIFLDADVICDPGMVGDLAQVLISDDPRYASGTFTLLKARSVISRLYGQFWMELPFMKSGAVGAGLFAMNRAGRARWDAFPDIISDDTFVRLMFTPQERHEVAARYHWPLAEGFTRLVKVRRRQNAGVAELEKLYPDILENENKPQASIASLALKRPLAFAVYAAVQLAVKLLGPDQTWTRIR